MNRDNIRKIAEVWADKKYGDLQGGRNSIAWQSAVSGYIQCFSDLIRGEPDALYGWHENHGTVLFECKRPSLEMMAEMVGKGWAVIKSIRFLDIG